MAALAAQYKRGTAGQGARKGRSHAKVTGPL